MWTWPSCATCDTLHQLLGHLEDCFLVRTVWIEAGSERQRHEVDFLARAPDGTEHLIQVCADAADPATAAREIAALQEAGRHREGARRWLFTLTRDRLPANPPDDVTCCPAYEWMLAEGDAFAPE